MNEFFGFVLYEHKALREARSIISKYMHALGLGLQDALQIQGANSPLE